MADHPSIDDLADAAEGLLDPGRSREVAEHVPGCPTCQQAVTALGQVRRTLAAAPAPPESLPSSGSAAARRRRWPAVPPAA